MHMSSSEVNPKTSVAFTQFPVYVWPGYAASVGVHSPGSGPSAVQSFAAPDGFVNPLPSTTLCTTDCPGGTPGCSSHPRRGSVALSCVHWYSMRCPGLMSNGGFSSFAIGSEYTVCW